MTYPLTFADAGPFPAAPRPPRARLLARAIERLRAALAAAPGEPAEPDLIDHPAFRGMSPRELADLPFPRHPMGEPDRSAP